MTRFSCIQQENDALGDLPRLSDMDDENERDLIAFLRLIWFYAARLQILCRQNLGLKTGTLPKAP
jgi:hypothetical protein